VNAELRCRSCSAPLAAEFIDLGLTPISNAFVQADRAAAPDAFYPLRSLVCESCRLVQLQDFEVPQTHFHEQYAYFSSYSDAWLAHCRRYVEDATKRFSIGPQSRVIEVGSNDGCLLQYFVEQGIPCLGIDPASNCASVARDQRQVPTEVAFFGTSTAKRLADQGLTADLMIANNVLAHVPDINDFVAGFQLLLKPQGTITFEFPHLLELIRNVEFDTIYHEHYSYLSVAALEPLFARHALKINDVERLPTHGGSLRLHVRHAPADETAALAALRAEELAYGLQDAATYDKFRTRVRALKRELLSLLIDLKNAGKRIVGYGAPAKGNTLLNYCGIGKDFLLFTVDRNVHKQGLLLPGTRIPIKAPEAIFREKPDFILILPWNLQHEITSQLAGIRDWGGRFIVPIPHPRVLE
jgi:ubiquinone/menaquinone biosynthesis C-methylase UbiE